jgi:hypothetical protein
MPASFNKFHAFMEAVAEKKHNLATDTLKVMLTNELPAATDAVKADINEIPAGNGYTAGGAVAAQVSSGQVSGTYKLVLADVVFTAAGGSIGPFQYAVLWNDTAAADDLIGWYDYGASITLNDTEPFTVDCDPTAGVLTMA